MAFTKEQPSYTRYSKMNKNVEGVNWDQVNQDRRQVGTGQVEMKTEHKK